MVSRTRNIYTIMLFFILLACYTYFRPSHNSATDTRADVVYSLVEDNTLIIDRYEKNTGDKAFFEGHYYTDKSIGPSVIALPAYVAFRAFASLPPVRKQLQKDTSLAFKDELANEPLGTYANWALTVMTFFGAVLPSVFLGILVFFFVNRFTSTPFYAFVLAIAFGLCTIAFTYSKGLFQHQLASFGLFGGFYFLWTVIYENKSVQRLWLVGFLFSLAIISEYPMVLFVGAIGLWALIVMKDRKAIFHVVIGSLPLLLINIIYDVATFRSVIPLGYQYSLWSSLVNVHGFMGIGLPSLKVMGELLFGTFRGLFLISPFLIFVVPGLIMMWKQKPQQHSLVILISVIILGFLTYGSGYIVWWGGYSVGARLLTPMLPFMVVPIIFVLNRWFGHSIGCLVISLLILAGLLNTWTQSISESGLPNDAPPQLLTAYANDDLEYNRHIIMLVNQGITVNPLLDFGIPSLVKGDVAYNYGRAFKLRGVLSLLPLIVCVGLILVIGWYYLSRENKKLAIRPVLT